MTDADPLIEDMEAWREAIEILRPGRLRSLPTEIDRLIWFVEGRVAVEKTAWGLEEKLELLYDCVEALEAAQQRWPRI